jgi:flagellar biogenesis protein FliO
MNKPAILIAILICLAVCGSVSAQSTVADSAGTMATPGISDQLGSTLLKMGLALVLIVGLIYLSVIMLRKLSYGKMGKQTLSGTIQIVDRNFVSPKKQLCLVRIDKKILLVGITEQAINLVADVSDQDFESKQTISKAEYPSFSFKRLFTEAKVNLPFFSQRLENPQKS